MDNLGESESPQASTIRRTAFASFIGTAIEWYDFFIYGTSAALVFPKLFFPELNALSAVLASFATFGVAFIARPLGGFAFGHFGDLIGRKPVLVITLLMMGSATFLVGVLPTYEQVGQIAPVLLVILRFLQGFAVGGEWGGATLLTVEHAPEKRRTFYASWPQTGVPIGLMLSSLVFGAFSSLPDEQFFTWGWRGPFLLSVILIAVGLFIRLRVLESPVFSRLKELGMQSKAPLIEVLRDYPFTSALASGVLLGGNVQFYIVTIFTPVYASAQFGVSRSVLVAGLSLGSAAELAGIVIFARIADRIGKRPVAIWSAVTLLCLPYPYFWLVNTGNPVLIYLAVSICFFAIGALYGITGVFLAEHFPARVRYSGISFGYQMSGLLGSAPAPIVATALLQWAGGNTSPIAAYMTVNALLSLVAIYLASDACKVGIHDEHPAEVGLARIL